MAIEQLIDRLKAEILNQCEDDLVRFLEIDWFARQEGAEPIEERRRIIADVVADLVASGKVEVGDAVDIGGFVDLQVWPEKDDDLRQRLRQVTLEFTSSEHGEGFWLAKTAPES